MAKLVHSQAGKVFGEYPLQEGALRIGRGLGNDICLEDLTVSACHALIEVVPSAYMEDVNDVFIIDQKSTNGTIVNGKHIKRHLLKHGEVVAIGQHDFCLIDEETRGLEQTMIYIPDDE